MTVSTHDIALESLDALTDVDALCLFVGEDERPLRGVAGFVDWRLCGRLSRVLIDRFFTGAEEDRLLFASEGRLPMSRIFALGVGRLGGLGPDGLGRVLASAAKVLSKAGVKSVAFEIPGAGAVDEVVRAGALSRHFLPAFPGGRVAIFAELPLRQLVPTRG